MIHSLITQKTPRETEAFIQRALTYLTCARVDDNLARKKDPDSTLLTFFNTCGFSFNKTLTSSHAFLVNLEALLTEGAEQFHEEIQQISENSDVNSSSVLELLHEAQFELDQQIKNVIDLSENLNSLQRYALTLPQKKCTDLYSTCVADSWDHTLALVQNVGQKFEQYQLATTEEEKTKFVLEFNSSMKKLTDSSYFKFCRELSSLVTSNGYTTKEIVSDKKKPLFNQTYPIIERIIRKTKTTAVCLPAISTNFSETLGDALNSSNSKQLAVEPTPYTNIDVLTAVESAANQAKSKPRLASLPAQPTNPQKMGKQARDVRFGSTPVQEEKSKAKKTLSTKAYGPIKRRIAPEAPLKLTFDGSKSD